MELKKKNRCFGGELAFYEHVSEACPKNMRFSIYVPDLAKERKLPVLYWLSGLTCTEENFMAKSGAQRCASEHGLILVAPDTSPRGAGIEGEDDHWDFGTGAGFYVNATEPKWSAHYQMYRYVNEELPKLIETHFPAYPGRRGISGHSMGGHGALVSAFREPDKYLSVSAFAPICAPTQCPWGEKAFSNYLGSDKEQWKAYDATEWVAKTTCRLPVLIDQGTDDEFLEGQLKPDLFEAECQKIDYPLTLRRQPGYDHSYYFIASFIEDHLAHHAKALNAF